MENIKSKLLLGLTNTTCKTLLGEEKTCQPQAQDSWQSGHQRQHCANKDADTLLQRHLAFQLVFSLKLAPVVILQIYIIVPV